MRIELTNACNMACSYCYASPNTRADLMTTAMIQKAIDTRLFVTELGVMSITGGEPFLEPALLAQVIDFLVSKNFTMLQIHTNGTLITDKNLDPLVSADPFMRVSFTGHNAKINDVHRSNFAEAEAGAKLVVSRGFRLGLTFVITDKNYLFTGDFITFAENIGASAVTFRRCFGLSTLTYSMIKQAINDVNSVMTDLHISIRFCLEEPEKIPCFGRPCLMANGDIHLCNNIKQVAGNISTLNKYTDLITGTVMSKMQLAQTQPDECAAITYWKGNF